MNMVELVLRAVKAEFNERTTCADTVSVDTLAKLVEKSKALQASVKTAMEDVTKKQVGIEKKWSP